MYQPALIADATPLLTVLGFMAGAVGFLLLPLIIGRLVRLDKPNAEKNAPYESGEEAVGHAHGRFNLRFFKVVLLFLLFEVELVLLFPWATVYGDQKINQATNGLWGWMGYLEILAFITLLALGLAYAWAKGHLQWVKVRQPAPTISNPLPEDAYAHLKGQQTDK